MLTNDADCLSSILRALPPRELAKCECVCADMHLASTADIWRDAGQRVVDVRVTAELVKTLSRNEWKQLCRMADRIGKMQEAVGFRDCQSSTTDHFTERASNVLTPSRCCEGRPKCLEECGCWRGAACYWSSAAIEDGALAFESLSLTPPGPARAWILVTELLIRPYRAFWHPGAPVYAPREAAARIRGRAGSESPTVCTIKQPVAHQADALQTIASFDPPLLLTPHCTVEIELCGAVQRCPAEFGTTDFYVCLSHVCARGCCECSISTTLERTSINSV